MIYNTEFGAAIYPVLAVKPAPVISDLWRKQAISRAPAGEKKGHRT